MKAMILAAGRGERMRPLTDHTPKPLLQVGGKPLIVWHIERLVDAGITEVVINHAYLGDQIERALGDGSQWGVSIQYSREQEALETAGGVAAAIPLLGDAPFLLISADIYAQCNYSHLLDKVKLLESQDWAYLWMVDNPPWHARGDFALHGQYIDLQGEPRMTYANLGIYRPEFFATIEPGTKMPMLPLFQSAISQNKVKGGRYVGLWENVGNPQQLAALDALLRKNE